MCSVARVLLSLRHRESPTPTQAASTVLPITVNSTRSTDFPKVVFKAVSSLFSSLSVFFNPTSPVIGDPAPVDRTARIGVHYMPDVTDIRPRLNLTFVYERDHRQRSLMFDTASSRYAVAAGHNSSLPSCGYMLSDEAVYTTLPDEWIGFGSGAYAVSLKVLHRVEEIALLAEIPGDTSGGFLSPLVLLLTPPDDPTCTANPGIDKGIFGASFASNFSSSVNNFALIPARESPGILAINDMEYAQNFCETGVFEFFSLDSKLPLLWAIGGIISINNSGPVSRLSFIFDTGASSVYVTKPVYARLISDIESLGSVVRHDESSGKKIVSLCGFNWTRFPAIEIKISDAISFTLYPKEYLRNYNLLRQTCELDITVSAIHGREDICLIGMKFIERFVTLFDRQNRRVGMCSV